ncbi:MAG: hypothetical protein ACJ74F_07970 [Mycobacterium sp.]|jgi:hypothetical protein|uniref:hypothetical protein n=1 Tax=Mycobacterium sp. TaxID=1785 RepID=UPI00389AC723
MKLALALRELHRSERGLAVKLDAVAARHQGDHAIRHVATDLTGWSRNHVDEIATVGRHYGLHLRWRPHVAALSAPLQQRLSELVGRRQEPALVLLADLRRVYQLAAGVSVDWELLAQGAQAAKDERLLQLSQRCHPETLRQMRWANAMLKELAPQTLTS